MQQAFRSCGQRERGRNGAMPTGSPVPPAAVTLTIGRPGPTIVGVDDLDPIDSREAARIRRRDREADAERSDLMRPGMGKVFKQIQDAWRKPAAEPSAEHSGKRSMPRRPPRP
jgi:hypothetical protein